MNKKNLLFLISLFTISHVLFSQSIEIDNEIFKFQIDKNFKISDNESNKIKIVKFESVDKIEIAQEITLIESGINPKDQNIKDISDISSLEQFFMVSEDFVKENDIDGITKINNIDVFFSLSLIKSFKDYNKTELKGYEFTAKYYFFVKEKIYLLLYQSKLINPGGYDFNKKEIYTLMEKRNNLGYLNEILQTLELK